MHSWQFRVGSVVIAVGVKFGSVCGSPIGEEVGIWCVKLERRLKWAVRIDHPAGLLSGCVNSRTRGLVIVVIRTR